jgi:hypothetical protein
MKVRAFLKTPLYRSRARGEDNALTDAVLVVSGTAESRDGGLEVEVATLHNEKGVEVEAPFHRIFLPLAKIDYYVIEQA